MKIDQFITKTIAQSLNRDPFDIPFDATLAELGMDSLAVVSVIAQIEAVFGLELSTDETLQLLEEERVFGLRSRIQAHLRRMGIKDDPHAKSKAIVAKPAICRVRPSCSQLFLIFRGRWMGLMLPPQEFIAQTRLYDRNIMLFGDYTKADYMTGASVEHSNFMELVEWQREEMSKLFPHVRSCYALGTSIGALAAVLSGHLLGLRVVWAFSLPFIHLNHDGRHYLDGSDLANDVWSLRELLARGKGNTEYRLFYNVGHEGDRLAAESLKDCPGVQLFPQPGDSHLVVFSLAEHGKLENLMDPFESV